MDDDNLKSTVIKGLKNEWALFWESIAGEGPTPDAFETGKLEILSADQLH
jgi:hypothetical protein